MTKPMTSLMVAGGMDAHGQPIDLLIVDGVVAGPATPPRPDRTLDATGLTVLPGLVDLQVNGARGLDLTADPSCLWDVAAALPAYGVTAFAPTLITCDAATHEEALAALRQGPPEGWTGARPLGLHFEGPMIAPEYVGAHPHSLLAEPTAGLIRGWSRRAGVLMVTLAPELPGALDAVRALVARGVVVSIGHTAATGEEVEAAVAAGASAVTHLGNAMPSLRSREPGPVGVALAGPELVAGVICDGQHLHPATLRAFWQALGPDRFLTVSDATAALGLPDGPTALGVQEVEVRDGAVRLSDGTLAGSAAGLATCVTVLMRTTGCPLATAVVTATQTPARLVGDSSRGSLAPGSRGDLVVVDAGGAGLEVVATVVGGVVVHRPGGG